MTLVDHIRQSIIGRSQTATGPFGTHPVVYADYTASGRALRFIEDYLSTMVLPGYANTHSESSATGIQTSRFRREARRLVASGVGATDEHALLFCGSGATAAIDKIIGVLGLRIPSNLDDRHQLSHHVPGTERPVVFIGPYEHHSNELPWRESIADVRVIEEDCDGHLDLDRLEAELEQHRHRPLLIGSFSAASNVTGIKTDTYAVSSLLHRHGALAFWDFAAAAPYVDIDMGRRADGPGYFDAIFVSPHKFIGGPGTPGLLVARRELFTNRVPTVPGGGTVTYVSPTDHHYIEGIEEREEGGTPDIIGSIRAGLVFQLKAAVGAAEIERREEQLIARALEALDAVPEIEILGNQNAARLSIISFVVRCQAELPDRTATPFLHHNFVVALLNDLFGIQARGGCSCAGPYGHRLLHIDRDSSLAFEREINRGCEGIKPGWVRVNFNYFIDDETLDYIVGAIELIARSGTALLPYYRFEPGTGLWHHRRGPVEPPHSLADIDYSLDVMDYERGRRALREVSLSDRLAETGERLAELIADRPEPLPRPDTNDDFELLRWFPYPAEA
ncbi:MAG: aminotransferase class V-fold PLP-dependent enzyme [Acidimicrobiales bacterium]